MKRQMILFLAANPAGTDSRALEEEARAIQTELERSGYRDYFTLETRWAAQPLDLLRALRKLDPTIVHFSGHGGPCPHPVETACPTSDEDLTGDSGVTKQGDRSTCASEGIFFQDDDGRAQLVSVAALRDTFAAAASSVKLVVLSGCYGDAQAEALCSVVDCVIGMAGATRNGLARSFAVGLYGGLGEHESISKAFKQGCAAISLCGLPDSDGPRIRVRDGVDADRLVLGPRLPSRSGFVRDDVMVHTPEQPARLLRIFLSHADQDRQRVLAIKALLELGGAKVVMEDRFNAPDDRARLTPDALADCDFFCVFWSVAALKSKAVFTEWTTFASMFPDRSCVVLRSDQTPLPVTFASHQSPPEFFALANEFLALRQELMIRGVSRQEIRRIIGKRLRDAGLQATDLQLRKVLALFGGGASFAMVMSSVLKYIKITAAIAAIFSIIPLYCMTRPHETQPDAQHESAGSPNTSSSPTAQTNSRIYPPRPVEWQIPYHEAPCRSDSSEERCRTARTPAQSIAPGDPTKIPDARDMLNASQVSAHSLDLRVQDECDKLLVQDQAIQDELMTIRTNYPSYARKLELCSGALLTDDFGEKTSCVSYVCLANEDNCAVVAARIFALTSRSAQLTRLERQVCGSPVTFTNSCTHPVHVAILYQTYSGTWESEGWWSFSSHETNRLQLSAGKVVSTKNSHMYYYAETVDGSRLEWSGDTHTVMEGRVLAMKEANSSSVVRLSCDQN